MGARGFKTAHALEHRRREENDGQQRETGANAENGLESRPFFIDP